MRILLAQNSLYYPSHGGGDKSNRLLMEALAARGHACRAVALQAPPESPGVVTFHRAGVEVQAAPRGHLRAHFAAQVESFQPEVILASTDDPAQLLLEVALRAESARVIYLARATLAVPFGPDCAFPSEVQTARIRAVDRVVGVSQYVADYFRKYAGIEAVHVPISLTEPGVWPALGRFDGEFVTMANPCAVKGISIFLALAAAFPETAFAAVPTWGTNEHDRAALASLPNVHLLHPVDDIDCLFARTRVLLVPSLWAEARSRIVLEAMLRGIPVMAANVGGIPEAKMGVPYLLPVNPIARFHTRVDERMVPVADVPPQEIAPWREALHRLLTDAVHYQDISARSRAAALEYARSATVEPFERLLEETRAGPRRAAPTTSAVETLSPEKRHLLALRLRKRAPASSWFPSAEFPGADAVEGLRLFWFPHAGAGASAAQALGIPHVPVRLPGRESRIAEAPFERMSALVEALAAAIEPYVAQPFAFFGHSMGAAVAFELARLLRRRALPLPRVLIASAARAPQFRRNHVPPPPPSREQLLEELRRLEGIPPEVLADPSFTRSVLPALEADSTLYRNYLYSEDAPLPCPVRAYGGSGDANILREHLDAWQAQTTASFRVRLFPGGHFYLNECPGEVRRAIEEDLR